MDKNQTDIDLIERYINGKLTSSEVYNFENRLGEDREFARKYRLRKTFPEMMNEAGDTEPVKTEVKPLTRKIERKPSNRLKPVYLAWGAIGVITLCMLIFFIAMKTTQPVEKPETAGSVPLNDSNTIPRVNQPGRIIDRKVFDSDVKKPIELEAPDDGMTFGRKEEILFRWKQETDSFTNFYVFSEIHDKRVWWRGIKPGIREYKVVAINFLPGRFYWYVGTNKEKRTFIIGE